MTRSLQVGPRSRTTVPVFDPAAGVGPGWGGVSTQLTSDQPIVAERPIYVVHDFGSGTVAGAHDAVGATALGRTFEFGRAGTRPGEYDYLTIQNPQAVAANLTISYFGAGPPITRTLAVQPHSRHTVEVFNPSEGAGPGLAALGIVVASDQPIQVEKPTYTTGGTGGATDTLGYQTP